MIRHLVDLLATEIDAVPTIGAFCTAVFCRNRVRVVSFGKGRRHHLAAFLAVAVHVNGPAVFGDD